MKGFRVKVFGFRAEGLGFWYIWSIQGPEEQPDYKNHLEVGLTYPIP